MNTNIFIFSYRHWYIYISIQNLYCSIDINKRGIWAAAAAAATALAMKEPETGLSGGRGCKKEGSVGKREKKRGTYEAESEREEVEDEEKRHGLARLALATLRSQVQRHALPSL